MPGRGNAAKRDANRGAVSYTSIINEAHLAQQAKVKIDLIVVISLHRQRIFNVHSLDMRLNKNGVAF